MAGNVAIEPWHEVGAAGEPAFNTGWSNYGGGYETMAFRKTPDGRVHLKGNVKAAAGANQVVFALPVGYRPANHFMGIGQLSKSNATEVGTSYISNAGAVWGYGYRTGTYTAFPYDWYSFEGVNFATTQAAFPTGPSGADAAPRVSGALPSPQYDGQEIVYVADAAAGVLWRLRYNAGSASAYKWEFVGGSPFEAAVPTSQTFTADGAYRDPATAGPDVTVPLAGDYAYEFSTLARGGTGAGQAFVGLVLGAGATPVVPHEAVGQIAASGYLPLTWGQKMTGLSASQLLRLRYAISGAGTGTVVSRRVAVRPIRVG